MIVFVTQSTLPIDTYLRSHGRSLADRFRVCSYAEFLRSRTRPSAVVCFADLERLTDATRARAGARGDELLADGALVLNHPLRTLRRYDLLRALHATGQNRFAARRAGEAPASAHRFPVFVRGEHDHDGSRTELLHTPDELDAALAALAAAGHRDDNLVVEFLDTANRSRTYRKYGAFIVGDRVVARHLFLGDAWQLKGPQRTDDAALEEEWTYLSANPHADEIRAIAAAAGIRYGRIDYALLDDTIQTWEFNTNPWIAGMLAPAPHRPWVVRRARALARPAARRLRRRSRPGRRPIDDRPRPRDRVNAAFAAELADAWIALGDRDV